MFNLRAKLEQQRAAPAAAATAPSVAAAAAAAGSESTSSKQVCVLKLTRELDELELPAHVKLSRRSGDDLQHFALEFAVASGIWRGGRYRFAFDVPDGYPFAPPKVVLETPIFHPNIDASTGAVCLNILRPDWSPILGIQSVVYGLDFLFLEPNSSDPLNREAAEMMAHDPDGFARHVRQMIVRQFR